MDPPGYIVTNEHEARKARGIRVMLTPKSDHAGDTPAPAETQHVLDAAIVGANRERVGKREVLEAVVVRLILSAAGRGQGLGFASAGLAKPFPRPGWLDRADTSSRRSRPVPKCVVATTADSDDVTAGVAPEDVIASRIGLPIQDVPELRMAVGERPNDRRKSRKSSETAPFLSIEREVKRTAVGAIGKR